MSGEIIRCGWAKGPLYEAYHDNEWGRPLHDEHALFELLMLEGKQAGLSWITILKRREELRRAFDGFNPEVLCHYDDAKIQALLANPNIIRNRLKVQAARENARAYFKLKDLYGSLDNFMWRYVDYVPIQNAWRELSQLPAQTKLSEQISKDLKKLGFKFVGPTIVYAYMQSMGMVNDHLVSCHCYETCKNLK